MGGLPSGLVTFVFTDIEGSTRLLQHLGDDYRASLETHRVLLREAFVRHRGVEIQTEGDSFFVAFHAASDALAACLAGQRALQEHEWLEGGAVRVRMGVHTGEAEPTDGDYVALAVHQAARVAAAGHGGQVLLTEGTRDAVGGSMPQR